jgi:DNA-binding HxlR family transcriptional regulator
VPPKVEYSLSARGRTLEPVIMALKAWGDANIDLSEVRKARVAADMGAGDEDRAPVAANG